MRKIGGKRKTNEEFVKQLEEINPNIKALESYIDSRIKMKFECLICGHTWSTMPGHVLQSKGCPECAKKSITKTHKEFIDDLSKINKNIICLDEYVNMKTKIKFKCLLCDHIWYTTPSHILRGQGCPKCATSKAIKTNDNFLKELKSINPNVKVLEEYVNNHTKLLCECLIDGNKWYATPNSLLQGHGCPECWKRNIVLKEDEFLRRSKEMLPTIKILTPYTKASDNYLCECTICGHQWTANGNNIIQGKAGCRECYKVNKRLTNKEFLIKLNNVTNDIIPLDEYYDANTKIKFQCKICGSIWETTSVSILNGSKCPECYKKKIRSPKKSHKEFVEQAKILNPYITILGKYMGANKRVLCKCDICGFEWEPISDSIIQGHGCPKCTGRHKTTEEFKKEIYSINPDIEVLSEYTNANTMMKCKCKICGHIWEAKANNLRYKGCPQCNTSNGERYIKRYLINKNIKFIPQKTFHNLKGIGGRYLSYDFYLPEYNLLIEFQGVQHEKPIEHFGGEEQFKIQQEHDKRKKEYAKLHKIRLLEIWYYDIDNIEEILTKKINKINNLKLESVETAMVI